MDVVAYVREIPGSTLAYKQIKQVKRWCRDGSLQLIRIYSDTLMPYAPGLTRNGITGLLDHLQGFWVGVVVTHAEGLHHPHLGFDPTTTVVAAGKEILVTTSRPQRVKSSLRSRLNLDAEDSLINKAIPDYEAMALGRRESAKRGNPGPGPSPYGYVRNDGAYVAHPMESLVVQKIFRLYLREQSMRFVAQTLDEEGYRTRKGSRWSRAALSWILKNEVYVGLITYDNLRVRGKHKPIVARIIYNRVQVKLRKQNKRNRKPNL